MKDQPHHIQKLSRKVIQSYHKMEEIDAAPSPSPWKKSKKQVKKQAKEQIKQKKKGRAIHALTPEEQNNKLKHKEPVLDFPSHNPRKSRKRSV